MQFPVPLPDDRPHVQGHLKAQELPTRTYVTQNCAACGSVHLVNPHTGKLMSEEIGKPQRQPASGPLSS